MIRKIRWSNTAISELREMTNYLYDKGAIKASQNLKKEINKKIEMLAEYPEIGRFADEYNGIQYYRVSKYHLAFYKIKNNTLIIMCFFDDRQDPDKRPY